MSEFKKVIDLYDLVTLDVDEIKAGYNYGIRGGRKPGSDKSRAFWHGWRHGAVGIGSIKKDKAMRTLLNQPPINVH